MKLAKIQIEDIKAELSKDGWNLISTEYHNLDEILEYTCNEGHHVFAPWKKFVLGAIALYVKKIH